jgi:hypothetical protein
MDIEKRIDPPVEFTLRLIFDNAREVELRVTHFDPTIDGNRIARAKIEQELLQLGDEQVSFIDWSRVVFAAVYSRNGAFEQR